MIGVEYLGQTDGTIIYGIACTPRPPGFINTPVYGYLYKRIDSLPGNSTSCLQFMDSAIIANSPSNYLSVPCYRYGGNLAPIEFPIFLDTATIIHYRSFPMFEGYFDSGHPIDSVDFGVMIGSRTRYSTELCSMWGLRIYSNNDYLPMTVVDFNDPNRLMTFNGRYRLPGIYPITDRNRWLEYITGQCQGIVHPFVRYSYDGTEAEIRWSDLVGHPLYEVAYGPYDADPDSFTTETTTQWSFFIRNLTVGDSMIVRVRAMCLYEDTVQVWSPWSETVWVDKGPFTVTAESNNPQWGTVSGSGTYERGEDISLEATPAYMCRFEMWSDRDTANPRPLHVTSDTSFTAIFSFLGGMDTAEPLTLQVAPNPTNGKLSLSANGSGPFLYEISDSSGRKVAQGSFYGPSATIDVESLPAGHYSMKLSSRESSATAVFVVVH